MEREDYYQDWNKTNDDRGWTRAGESFLSNQPLSRLEKGHGHVCRVLGSGGGQQAIIVGHRVQNSRGERYDDLGILRLEVRLDSNKTNQKCQKENKPTTTCHPHNRPHIQPRLTTSHPLPSPKSPSPSPPPSPSSHPPSPSPSKPPPPPS